MADLSFDESTGRITGKPTGSGSFPIVVKKQRWDESSPTGNDYKGKGTHKAPRD